MCFKVIRERDGVMLAQFDTFDVAMSYATALAPTMGDLIIRTEECE